MTDDAGDHLQKITVTDRATGKPVIRYQVTVDAGSRDVVTEDDDGNLVTTTKRVQTRKRYRTEKEARTALGEILDQVTKGVYVTASTLTVEKACSDWLAGRRIRPTTPSAYTHALQPLRNRHGTLAIQKLNKRHLDDLVTDLIAGKVPKADGGMRKGWSSQSINPMLNVISAVLTGLMKQGHLVRDVAALVDRVPNQKKEMKTFTEQEVRKLLASADKDRNGHAWHLALSGLRRGEICGLRWTDVDMKAGTVTIAHNRVSANGKAVDGAPKTEKSIRTLPSTPNLTAALKAASKRQKAEPLALGEDYGPGDHVVCDEAGRAYHPDTISDCWRAICKTAKVSPIRLHDARHTCGTLMHLQGVPIAVISAWLGHSDSAFTMRTYMHSQDDALNAAAASLQALVTFRDTDAG
ncbi:tyrosine-type recombinase/integrase [Rhodococcus qingshengii]|uniref:tyrosine-type recombinase/integrase n=1 Tax=Rhodococcus TaxID=1827 RepID=UPI001BA5F58D|nr:tyrosine-type recombinase/integrase [Rhodococcus qingshengii]MBS3693072.1 site-specific integrase [Rhodococcus qingshengii]